MATSGHLGKTKRNFPNTKSAPPGLSPLHRTLRTDPLIDGIDGYQRVYPQGRASSIMSVAYDSGMGWSGNVTAAQADVKKPPWNLKSIETSGSSSIAQGATGLVLTTGATAADYMTVSTLQQVTPLGAVSTTVNGGSQTGASQLVVSSTNFAVGDAVYFVTTADYRTIVGVDVSVANTLTLNAPIASTNGETVRNITRPGSQKYSATLRGQISNIDLNFGMGFCNTLNDPIAQTSTTDYVMWQCVTGDGILIPSCKGNAGTQRDGTALSAVTAATDFEIGMTFVLGPGSLVADGFFWYSLAATDGSHGITKVAFTSAQKTALGAWHTTPPTTIVGFFEAKTSSGNSRGLTVQYATFDVDRTS